MNVFERAVAVDLNVMDFVEAAKLRGEGKWWVIFAEILPNALSPLVSELGLRFIYAVLFLSALSFLGLGVQPPTASWGAMLSTGRNYVATAWWVATLPGICLFVLVLAVNLTGDAVRDRLDPRHR